MSCFISTGCLQGQDLHQMVALAARHGFDLELSSALPHHPAPMEALSPAPAGVRFLVHNYFPAPASPFVLNLASADPGMLQRSIELCRQAIELCAALGAPFYSVHAGFALEMDPGMLGNPELQGIAGASSGADRGRAWSTFLEAVRALADFAAPRGVGLLLENNVLSPQNLSNDGGYPLLLADVAEIQAFFRELERPQVGLLLDVGHAKVSAQTLGFPPQRFFDALGGSIRCLHLSDNDGLRDSNLPFSPSSWFYPYLERCREIPMVIEVYRSSLEEILALRSMIEAI